MVLFFLVIFISPWNAYSADYFPLKKGITREYEVVYTRGMDESKKGAWSVTVVADSYMVGDVETIPLRFSNGSLLFILKNKEGIFKYAVQGPSDSEPTISKEVMAFIYPIKIGTNWKTRGISYLLAEKHEMELEVTIDKLDETVVTPAGVYNDCLRIKYYGEKKIDDKSIFLQKDGKIIKQDAKVSIEIFEYYAPDIGLVKNMTKHSSNDVQVTGPGDGTAQIVTQLTKFTLE